MTAEFTGLCRDHSFERADDLCRRCGSEYCEICLVFPFGAKKPLCKECAMAAGGVRSHVVRAEMPKRELKKKVKAFLARQESLAAPALAADGTAIEEILHDPLTPTNEDLERVAAPEFAEGDAVAAELAESFAAAPQGAPVAQPVSGEAPADGVAPPVDWSQPFG